QDQAQHSEVVPLTAKDSVHSSRADGERDPLSPRRTHRVARRERGGHEVTQRGAALLELQRHVFTQLAELDKTAPADVDAIVTSVVAHLRAWRPESVTPLGVLPEPENQVRDPRS